MASYFNLYREKGKNLLSDEVKFHLYFSYIDKVVTQLLVKTIFKNILNFSKNNLNKIF